MFVPCNDNAGRTLCRGYLTDKSGLGVLEFTDDFMDAISCSEINSNLFNVIKICHFSVEHKVIDGHESEWEYNYSETVTLMTQVPEMID